MTFTEAVEKRNAARTRRKEFVKNDATPIGMLDAEYDWGYWDAVITIMDRMKLKEIDDKAVQ